MTDLSTKALTRLLDQAAPGPWEYKLENGYIMSDLVETLNGWIQTNDGETVLGTGLEISDEQELRNLALAAAAPDLAQDALQKREALRDLSAVWEAVSIDPDRTPAEQQLAAAVVDHIDQILGDHDE